MKTLKTRVNEIVSLQEKGRTSALKICKVIAGISADWDEISTDVSLVQERPMQKFISDELGYNKSTVSRMVQVSNRFLDDAGEVKPELIMSNGRKWNAAQLIELIPLTDEVITSELEVGGISSEMTAKEIRECVKEIRQLEMKDDETEIETDETVDGEASETENAASADDAVSDEPNADTEKALVIGEFVSAIELLNSLHIADDEQMRVTEIVQHLNTVLAYIENK